MKPAVTLVFVILFGVVTWVFYHLRPFHPEAVKKPVPAPMKLLPLEKNDQIVWIQVHNETEKETVTLKLEEDRWMIVYPITYPANELMAEGLVTALTLSKKARRLMREKAWNEYGLARPVMKIGVETLRSKKRRYLVFGDPSPVGDYIFARWEDEEEYFLLDSRLKSAFDRSVYSLRLKRIFRTPLKDVTKIRFRSADDEFEISHFQGKWFWMEPIPILGEVLEKDDRDQILSQLIDLHVKDFQDYEERKSHQLGFSILSPTIKLWTQEGDPEVLLLGDEVGARDAYYGIREKEDVYFLISKENIDNLFASVKEIASKYVNQGTSQENLLA